ncbi:MAG: adenine-specific methyltransferase EcoRI family protein [Oscillospiraceae bacterium]|nr:adenine-specific methyltransferase EcoRI family protein [Oscillospiraceae bacterium]
MAAHDNLQKAKATKNDEFYTQLTDIEHELKHYVEHFRGKVIYCNCDDPISSNFWRYFHLNYGYFGLKKLIATHYIAEGGAYTMEYTGGNNTSIYEGKVTKLKGNGDFRDEECINILKETDIVCTNNRHLAYFVSI